MATLCASFTASLRARTFDDWAACSETSRAWGGESHQRHMLVTQRYRLTREKHSHSLKGTASGSGTRHSESKWPRIHLRVIRSHQGPEGGHEGEQRAALSALE